ncbi:50S ribosomal protein L23 [candidate division WOR-3 bacterium]|uniref:Large ribosomal subunit protein uL23 n=1 Tax=candidate division WOR-3 bacterium TaxID=2052148 RepID=A0A937XDZ5_UNCW3|nr:50S ribosomal protein L23 [candidate division WOR-3 bacterium]
MTEPTRVVLSHVVTEKAERLKAEQSRYTFKVSPTANKIEIRDAVERLFKVHVREVRVMNYLGKMRRMGRFAGRRSDWKKAVVTLKQGERIESLER